MARRPKTGTTAVPEVRHLGILWCAAIVAVVLAILFHQSLFGGKGLVPADGIYSFAPWNKTASVVPSNVPLADQYLQFVPLRQFYHDELLKGHFPLWNPHLMAGVPSLAGMQGAPLFPTNLALSPIAPFVAAGWTAFLKLFAAGFFTILFLRRMGLANLAAVVGGLTFALSGFMVVWLGHPHTNSALMLPALLYFLEGAVAQPTAKQPWLGFAVAFGVMLLGGHAPTEVHVTLTVLAYALFRMFAVRPENRLKWLGFLTLALGAGLLIAAPQILPFIEYYRLSSTPFASESMARTANHLLPGALYFFLLPFMSGSPSAGFEQMSDMLGFGKAEYFNEHTLYVGVLALFLASVAILKRRCRFSFFFSALAVMALTVIYEWLPWSALMGSLPVLGSINHERLILVVDFSLAVLAALGADTLLRAPAHSRPRGLAIAFLGSMAVALLVLWSFVQASNLDGGARDYLLRQLWVPACGGIIAIVLTLRRTGPNWLPALCIGWTAFDLLFFGIGFNPAVPREQYYPATEAIRFIQQDDSVFRIVGGSTTLMPNTASMYGLDDVRGQDFMSVARFEEFVTGKAGNFYFYQRAVAPPPPLLMLNTKYLLAPQRLPEPPAGFELAFDKEIAVYRNVHLRGRAFAVFDYQVEPNPALLLSHVRDEAFDPEHVVWLEQEPEPRATGSPAPDSTGASDVRITSYAPDRVTVEVSLPRDGFVILADAHFPGWVARLDGQATNIYRADYAFRAVRVSAGRHALVFTYLPLSFYVGLGTAATVLFVVGGIWFLDPRRSR